jgi:hypothetical protein
VVVLLDANLTCRGVLHTERHCQARDEDQFRVFLVTQHASARQNRERDQHDDFGA